MSPIIVITLLVLGIYFYYKNKNQRRYQTKVNKEIEAAQKRKDEISEIIKSRPKHGTANESDIKDFKARILKDIQTSSIRKETPEKRRYTPERSITTHNGDRISIFKTGAASPRAQELKEMLKPKPKSEEFDKPLPRKEREFEKEEEPKGPFSMFN